ncbi:unnamed protein product [Effrenium voratum]|uniref:Uncharacterized protein n=1 Tax=Effrenium voratum TaxID=2562239 RepID=A0AA36NGZ3_9DINO|nr:unnamed protein product [Effrenium voratum]
MTLGEVICWTDTWVYHQCCDVQAYGETGLELCFGQSIINFHTCCPHPVHRALPRPGEQVEIVQSPWPEKPGCDATFPWAPAALAPALLHGPAYHPHTGEYIKDLLPAQSGRWSDEAEKSRDEEEQHQAARRLRVRQVVANRWEGLTFRSFMQGVEEYYRTGRWGIEMVALLTQIISNFAFALAECAPAALVTGLVKAESLYDLDLASARKMTRGLRRLTRSAQQNGRLVWRSAQNFSLWEDLLAAALRRTERLEESRRAPERPWLVDMVVPLCSPKELDAVRAGLALMGGSMPARDDFDGWPEGTARARQAQAHNRIRGHWRHARFRLHVYMVCGSYSLLGHDTDISTNDVAHLSKAIFNGLPGDLLRIFGEGGLPSIRLAKLEEEVPTGDVAVYLHHLAQASMSSSLANVSLLLHPDFLEHVRPWKMSQVFQALLNGAWSPSVDFLYLGWRHEGPVSPDGRVASHLRYHCDVEPWEGGKIGPCDSGYNPRLLQNLWRMVFGTDLSPFAGDDLGGYDFSQLLVTRRAVERRPARYWRYLSRVISARASFELLPGARGFISRRTDLSPHDPFNKGVCAWFEHLWHMLFDPRFFPDSKHASKESDLRAFTTLHDPMLPLGLRAGPDSVMGRHYWLSAEEQCNAIKDEQGCRILQMQRDWRRQSAKPFCADLRQPGAVRREPRTRSRGQGAIIARSAPSERARSKKLRPGATAMQAPACQRL